MLIYISLIERKKRVVDDWTALRAGLTEKLGSRAWVVGLLMGAADPPCERAGSVARVHNLLLVLELLGGSDLTLRWL